MKTKIRYLWESLKASFWFFPIILIIVGIILAFSLIYIDSRVSFKPTGLYYYVLAGGASSARSVLATIAGAMLGMASTVFSITLVVLTLASSQFGPRLLRNFMYDRLNQIVLGSFIATFIYCLLVLQAVKSDFDVDFIPHVSILFAQVLTISNIILLIVFIHHISISIQADKVISDIGTKLDVNIQHLFPENIGKDKEIEVDAEEVKTHFLFKKKLLNDQNGYIQAINLEQLLSLAKKEHILLEIPYRPGEFLLKGLDLVYFYTNKEASEEMETAIKDAFIFGKVRNPGQDIEFAIHQIVEIACRALSPGINDPFTAMACIDHLTSALSYLAKVDFPSGHQYDEDKQLRIIAQSITFSGIMGTAFNQIRNFAKDSPAVLIRLMERLGMMYRMTTSLQQKNIILKHAKMAYHTGEKTFLEAYDLDNLAHFFDEFKQV